MVNHSVLLRWALGHSTLSHSVGQFQPPLLHWPGEATGQAQLLEFPTPTWETTSSRLQRLAWPWLWKAFGKPSWEMEDLPLSTFQVNETKHFINPLLHVYTKKALLVNTSFYVLPPHTAYPTNHPIIVFIKVFSVLNMITRNPSFST